MVDHLMNETYTEDDLLQPIHEVPMTWIEPTVKRWCQEQRLIVLKTGSRAHNCFYKRSSVSAWRMAVLLYYLWGEKENARSKVIRFYSFMAQYILEGLLGHWGNRYDYMHRIDVETSTTTQRVTLFDQTPQEFSYDQLKELCMKLGLAPARSFLCKWKKAKLIHQPDPNVKLYVKMVK